MERLTYKSIIGGWTYCVPRQKAIDRLAAYEDTGLEPEEIESIKSLCLGGEHYVLGFLPPPNEPLTLEQLRAMDGEPVWGADGQCYIVNVKSGYAVDKYRGFRMLWCDGFFYRRKREEEDNETD